MAPAVTERHNVVGRIVEFIKRKMEEYRIRLNLDRPMMLDRDKEFR